MIKVLCPTCAKALEIPDEFAGQRGKCQYCGGEIQVPAQAPQTLPIDLDQNLVDDMAPASTYEYPQVEYEKEPQERGAVAQGILANAGAIQGCGCMMFLGGIFILGVVILLIAII